MAFVITNRVLLVSNRLPITIQRRKGRLQFSESVGGLATALSSVYKKYNYLWVGWPGIVPQSKEKLKSKLFSEYNCHPIFLFKKDVEKYYHGFCNETLWPLFHYFPKLTRYDSNQFECYMRINKLFCDKIVEVAKPNDIIWVHDYHLMLLPKLLRKVLPDATIGFFLHIPFPPLEIFRLLPWRKELLLGLLGADLIGFHTYEYSANFLNNIHYFLGIDNELGKVFIENRTVKVDVFPLGIDFERYFNAINKPDVKKEIKKFQEVIGKRKIILSIDRLDYIKGIPERLEAFETFLEKNPKLHEKFVFVFVVSPSRIDGRQYQSLKKEIDEFVGKINGKYGTVSWTPIIYIHQSLSSNTLSALYIISDIALLTPIRDGMNLIAKEYIASCYDGKGVLILSEMAGAAKELGEAIIVNPNNKEEIAEAIKKALELPEDEQIKRNRGMQKRLRFYDTERWIREFLESLSGVKKLQELLNARIIDGETRYELITDYKKSSSRLIFLDYDGTLVQFRSKPEDAKPDDKLSSIIKKLSEKQENEVVLVTGRDKETMDKWFDNMNISIIAEHGAWLRRKDSKEWEVIEPLTSDWKKDIRAILDLFVNRVQGSFVEEKEFSLAWHYRNVETETGISQANELMSLLTHLSANLEIGVLQGSKVIEIKNIGINKGRAGLRFLSKKNFQFILAIGDDFTDEALFRIL
ncbi:MAG: bifunctional alpha,alpha-trehalose-phosphate synthase (UDP-forming)/trehalose-phosphatase, partial [Candidatus Thermoplasmatota archaeon]